MILEDPVESESKEDLRQKQNPTMKGSAKGTMVLNKRAPNDQSWNILREKKSHSDYNPKYKRISVKSILI